MSIKRRVINALARRIVPRRPPTEDLGAIADLLQLGEFKILDVGARGGALDWINFLAPYSTYYACEPAADARAKLKRSMEATHQWKGVTPIPEAIAPQAGTVALNIMHHPGMSSLLTPNMDVVRTFGLENEFTVVRQIEVPAVTMTQAAKTYGFEDLTLIKVDTQGTELGILESGRDLLASTVQGVFIEVEFREFYLGQPLFSEVETFLRALGFELISLEGITRRRTTTGLALGYSRREMAWAHALFIKKAPKPDVVGEEAFFRATIAQIGIALAREQFDLAAERLMIPQFQEKLSKLDLRIDLDVLEAYVRGVVARGLYRDFCNSWPSVVKHRDRFLSR
jgi:FkbM family methyltransferase